MEQKINLRYLLLTAMVAAMLWFAMFVLKPANFWVSMSVSILALLVLVCLRDRTVFQMPRVTLRAVLIGVLSAVLLYAVFYVGNILSGMLFPFKDAQIASVYSNKVGVSPILIGTLLLLLIGPGEEIFWRGFMQKNLSARFGENAGYLLAVLLYTAVHFVTGNLMLIIAAFVCGIFWGWIYKQEKSLVPVMISHALWDFTMFILLPMQ